jgi:hypothetical protein
MVFLLKGNCMNTTTYTNEILERHLKPFLTKIKKEKKGQQVYSMDDNAKCHTAKVAIE